jgi:chromosome segregation ATPase
MNSNQISDPKKLKELEYYNTSIELRLLDEQKKFNNSKIELEDAKEKLEILERTINSSNKKIDAVRKEIDKVLKLKQFTPAKPNNMAKTFSNPPPIIQPKSSVPGFSAANTKPGLFGFFKRK